jgi:hypothetical protein
MHEASFQINSNCHFKVLLFIVFKKEGNFCLKIKAFFFNGAAAPSEPGPSH